MNEYRYSIYQSTRDLWDIPAYEVDAWIIKSSLSESQKMTIVFMTFDNLDEIKRVIVKMENGDNYE